MTTSKLYLAMLLAGTAALTPAIAQTANPAPAAATSAREEAEPAAEILVVGSRGRARTDVDRPVPVDVVGAPELRATGQTDLGQQLQFTSPSFNSAKYGVNGATNYADPASLRGLGPDQVLLLINGKRRHQFSALNLNVAPGRGTVVSDLNAIPSAAIKRIEVLRDGAAAQYGSDAIAGIVNLVLNDGAEGGTVDVTAGIFHEGDGETYRAALNHGFRLGGEGGFFNYTLEFFDFAGTNRSDTFDGALYPATPATYATTGPTVNFPYATANPRVDRGVYPTTPFVVGNFGANENRTYQAFFNSQVPISETTNIYAFGGYSQKDIVAFGFFRSAANFANSTLSIFPDGYVPVIPGTSKDYSAVVGANHETSGGLKLDLSIGYGHNELDQSIFNTLNPSLGTASPTSFYVGRTNFGQYIAEFNGSKNFDGFGGLKGLNIAFGLQARRDDFRVMRGDAASFATGPLAASGKFIGSSARPGIADRDEIDIARENYAGFVDVELDINDAFLVAAALRYENYSDFGGNVSGKLAARYKITDSFAVRGSYNRGFRAPSLAQIGNRVLTSTAQNNVVVQTQQVSSDDPRLVTLGVEQPRAEISNGFSAGVTGDFDDILGGQITTTLDVYLIDIKDRITISQGLRTADFPAIRALFPTNNEISFFTNQIDTRTKGIDFVATYRTRLSDDWRLDASVAASHNPTKVRRQRPTPAPILVSATARGQSLQLLDQTSIELIEVAIPQTKVLGSVTVGYKNVTVNARGTYFGSVKAFSTGLSGQDPNVQCDAAARCVQTFAAKAIFDLSSSVKLMDNLNITLGANNIFNTYPDKYNNRRDGFLGEAASYSNGQVPYSRNSNQFGFNGAYYYLSAAFSF
ncbi:TonB-dependent receptor [Sandarakinorhabdus sp.]|jgi:iron complex outermembrane recepter protein|uniref:TonB-dependent receptor plug domain-containing protein n=1 Tax=Sandarakinorhabdus sp. TaxID=1916663 RepID=UPI003342A655